MFSSFDLKWRFNLGEPAKSAEYPEFDDSKWRNVDLPHDWMIEQPRAEENPCGADGGYFEGGVAWYRKSFKAPKSWKNKFVTIEFDGVYHHAEFWLNGHSLGAHPFGYTSFAIDLNEYLRHGKDNTLAVRVDASNDKHTRWYSGSGIYRHVRLRVANPVHIPQWGVSVTTPRASKRSAVVRVETTVANESGKTATVKASSVIKGPGGKRVGTVTVSGVVEPGHAELFCGELEVDKPALWSPDKPNMYEADTKLIAGKKVISEETTPFGIRFFSFSADKGFVFNGKPTLMKGGCVHHDCGVLGSASIDRAEWRKIELLKSAGYNAVRCAHNPPSTAFLDACDRLGMFVMDESFDVWRARKRAYDYHMYFDDWWQVDLESMIYRDRNHPSIVIWSVGNEMVERSRPEGAEIAEMLVEHVHMVDPTRPVTAAVCKNWEDREGETWNANRGLFAALDIGGYNYAPDLYKSDHKKYPNRIMCATETFPKKAYEYWKAVEKLPYLIGDFVWTSLDYLGEAGLGHERFANDKTQAKLSKGVWHQANCGDIDLCGWKRPQSYYRDVVWKIAKKPYIAVHAPLPKGKKLIASWGWHDVQNRWDWQGAEGVKTKVDVYFEADEIQLKLNGRSLGRKPAGPRQKHIASFQVPYKPGKLEAIAYRKGRAVARSSVETTGDVTALKLSSDRNPIKADRNDLAYITVTAVDGRGRMVPDAAPFAKFKVSGPAKIAAIGSADPQNTEPYRGNKHSLWRGRALVVVQPTGKKGMITVTAAANGLVTATVKVKAK